MGVGLAWIQYLPDAPGINDVEVPWTDGVTYSFTVGVPVRVPGDLAADLLRASAAKFKTATDPALASAPVNRPADSPIPIAPATEAGMETSSTAAKP